MSKWKAKHFSVKLAPSLTLVISLRKFTTSKSRRSKIFRQLVVQTGTTEIKEIAFRLKRSSKRRRQIDALTLIKSQALPLTLVLLGLAGLASFGGQALASQKVEPVSFTLASPPIPNHQIRQLAYSEPTSLSIPSLDISANIIPVGQTSTGAIAMPPLDQTSTVGWYKYSPTPGELGPSVIVGHLDNYETTSIFWRLHMIQPGAEITINLADGQTAKFTVDKLLEVSQANFPAGEIYGNVDYPGLRLITCGGSYDSATGSYSENTVVFATLEHEIQRLVTS